MSPEVVDVVEEVAEEATYQLGCSSFFPELYTCISSPMQVVQNRTYPTQTVSRDRINRSRFMTPSELVFLRQSVPECVG